MKTWKATVTASLMTLTAVGAEASTAMNECVAVQLRVATPVAAIMLLRAKETVVRVFGEIGVSVRWAKSDGRAGRAACLPVEMQLDPDSLKRLNPDALAYALPYRNGGTQIHVLMERVLQHRSEGQDGVVLGYVMAHEIGHVLEGVSRHSSGGVMKAHWVNEDFAAMFKHALAFDNVDVDLIQVGISKRREVTLLAAAK